MARLIFQKDVHLSLIPNVGLCEGFIMASNTNQTEQGIVIRLKPCASQVVEDIERLIGLMPARDIMGLIDGVSLEANPRESKLGPVTDAIQESIIEDEGSPDKLFPFKSKGILIASANYRALDHGRFELWFTDKKTEGILDGGHNTLAIGAYILCQAALAAGAPEPTRKSMAIWEKFKEEWGSRKDQLDVYRDYLRTEEGKKSLHDRGISILDFKIPVELLVPAKIDDELCVDRFKRSLLSICDARNNNVQLADDTKANQEGLFDAMRNLFRERAPEFEKEISWKTNDGGRIKSRDLVALAWVPLSKTTYVTGEDKIVEAPAPTQMYSSKARCLDKFIELMRNDRITIVAGATQRELKDVQVLSALRIATDMPLLYDLIYQMVPSNYKGSFGNISAVRRMGNSSGTYKTPFYEKPADKPVPDGFIYPLVNSLRALIEFDSETQELYWGTDPFEFIKTPEFGNVITVFSGVIQQSDYDPQKVGKGAMSYSSAEQSVELAYFKLKMSSRI